MQSRDRKISGLQRSQSSFNSNSSRLTRVKISIGVILADLFAQFLLGMWLNLFASFANMPQPLSSMSGMMSLGMGMGMMMTAMSSSMAVLMAHMLNGYLLGILSLMVLALSIYSKKLGIAGLGIAGFGAVLLAGISGLSFTFSGFSNDLLSFLMSLGFITAFIVYFLELYLAR